MIIALLPQGDSTPKRKAIAETAWIRKYFIADSLAEGPPTMCTTMRIKSPSMQTHKTNQLYALIVITLIKNIAIIEETSQIVGGFYS